MKTIGRRSFALGVASAAACGRVQQETSPASALDAGVANVVDAGIEASDPCALPFPAFDVEGLSNTAPARRVLYTWTTKAQADELALKRELYTRVADDNGNKGWLFDYLEKYFPGDKVAQTLSTPEFQMGRYAWPIPWATLMSETEDYGRELVRIDLSEDAWFIGVDSYRSGSNAFSAFDMSSKKVEIAEALESPERIAGIFFSNGVDGGGCGSVGGAPGYREFHLCHHATVTEWSLRTEENLAVIDAAHALLTPLADICDARLPCTNAIWSRPAPFTTDLDRLMSCLAFTGNPGGSMTFSLRTMLQQAVKRLAEARFTPAPIRHRPNG